MFGSTGADTFVFANGHGHDVIRDFNAANPAEQLVLRGVNGFDGIGDLLGVDGAASQQGADVRITTSDNSSILLQNVSLAELDQTDFIF
jgi:Ca2+-binding RTX toxin-like protein